MDTNEELLFVEERKEKILEILKQKHKINAKKLCETFQVSGGTIRNDLREMEQRGLLTRTHGGAIEKTKSSFEPDTKKREIANLKQKQLIAEAAEQLIEDGDTIILDGGTTTYALAKRLLHRTNLYVVTNDIRIALLLEENEAINLILIGGQLRSTFHCITGTLGADMLSGLSVDKAFLGTNSFSLNKGATSPDIGQAEIRQKMASAAGKTILLCDQSKFGKNSFLQFLSTEALDTLVTDSVFLEDRVLLEEKGVTVIEAEKADAPTTSA